MRANPPINVWVKREDGFMRQLSRLDATASVDDVIKVMDVDGAVIIEVIFNLPGLGMLIRESITRRDYELIQGIILILAAFMMVWILITDLLYAWLDPRIRYS